jgi:hypothetical protein
LKFSIIGVSTSLKVKNSCPVYSFKFCFTFTFFFIFYFFSIVKFLVGAIINTSTPWNITTPCILRHGNGMFLSLH